MYDLFLALFSDGEVITRVMDTGWSSIDACQQGAYMLGELLLDALGADQAAFLCVKEGELA